MQSLKTFIRRNFESLLLSAQVFVDLVVLLFACWLGWLTGRSIGGIGPDVDIEVYRQVWALVSAVCLITFHAMGMYRPVKSLLNVEEFKAIAKGTLVSFFVFFTLLILLRSTRQGPEGAFVGWLVRLHNLIDFEEGINSDSFSRLTAVISFLYILLFTTVSRFASFKLIQSLHARGIGNRNVFIFGAGECGQKLQVKFRLVPTLGLNLVGFLSLDRKQVGSSIEHLRVLGSLRDLERLVGLHKVSEIFIALPECGEDEVIEVVAECDRIGVRYHVVPRFYHLFSYKIKLHNLDSIPLVTRSTRRRNFLGATSKRLFDILVSCLVLLVTSPVFLIAGILIKRQSKGPIFFIHERIGRDGRPFKMIKFRTMHHASNGDAPAPDSRYDPRITRIGRYLRRYSLDELPQFINVLIGNMSVVGPRPEMPFLVATYSPMQRERLRAKPGITGLWQISYARQEAIHDNVDYDLYYIENQSLLLDLVICALTGVAVLKGTGAY